MITDQRTGDGHRLRLIAEFSNCSSSSKNNNENPALLFAVIAEVKRANHCREAVTVYQLLMHSIHPGVVRCYFKVAPVFA